MQSLVLQLCFLMSTVSTGLWKVSDSFLLPLSPSTQDEPNEILHRSILCDTLSLMLPIRTPNPYNKGPKETLISPSTMVSHDENQTRCVELVSRTESYGDYAQSIMAQTDVNFHCFTST